MKFDFDTFIADIEQRKQALGLKDDALTTEALRNKGGSRSPGKRTMLERAEQRARNAGRKPIPAHY